MAKWLNETNLIKYWEDRCTQYSLPDGTKIVSVSRNTNFGKYPDISSNFLSDGRVVPSEIEWFTTNFDRHGHDIATIRDADGFLIVFKQDAGFPIAQIEINEEDFLNWFQSSSRELAQETISEIRVISKKSKEPQIFLFHVPKDGNRNFKVAFSHGIWGFPAFREVQLPRISQIKRNDIVIFIKNWTADPSVGEKGGRVPISKYVGKIDDLYEVVVTKGFFESTSPKIWEDEDYPYRFKFRKQPLFHGKDIPTTQKVMGESLRRIMHRLMTNGIIERIDSSLMTKLMSLCITD